MFDEIFRRVFSYRVSSSRSYSVCLLGLSEPENGRIKILRNFTVYLSTLLSNRKDFEVDIKLLQFVVTLESPLRVRIMSLRTPLECAQPLPTHSTNGLQSSVPVIALCIKCHLCSSVIKTKPECVWSCRTVDTTHRDHQPLNLSRTAILKAMFTQSVLSSIT